MTDKTVAFEAPPLVVPTAVPLLVAYDISENRRRTRLHRLLRGFGEPVQRSVFLCWVDAPRRRRLERLLDDFGRAAHKGHERIDCIPARSDGLPADCRNTSGWIVE